MLSAAAKRVAAGKLDVFALHGVELGAPPRWNRDPKTGVEAPPLTFGKLLDYRNPSSKVGFTVRLTQWFAGPWGGLLHACCFRRAASIAATTIPTRCVAS